MVALAIHREGRGFRVDVATHRVEADQGLDHELDDDAVALGLVAPRAAVEWGHVRGRQLDRALAVIEHRRQRFTGYHLDRPARLLPDRPERRAARARGAAFRAVGQEPGWTVEVVPGETLTAVLDYGERTIELPAPDVTPLDGGARGYQAEGDGVVVQLVIEPLVCFDSMSGHVHPETATLAVDGQRYHGCGAPLQQ